MRGSNGAAGAPIPAAGYRILTSHHWIELAGLSSGFALGQITDCQRLILRGPLTVLGRTDTQPLRARVYARPPSLPSRGRKRTFYGSRVRKGDPLPRQEGNPASSQSGTGASSPL